MKLSTPIYLVGYFLVFGREPVDIFFIEYIALFKLRILCGEFFSDDFGTAFPIAFRLQTVGINARFDKVVYYRAGTAVVLLMSWGMVFLTGTQTGIADISRRSWLFLVLSGLATGASWLCYYHALQIGAASKVVPIDKLSVVITLALAFVVLHEPFTAKSLIG